MLFAKPIDMLDMRQLFRQEIVVWLMGFLQQRTCSAAGVNNFAFRKAMLQDHARIDRTRMRQRAEPRMKRIVGDDRKHRIEQWGVQGFLLDRCSRPRDLDKFGVNDTGKETGRSASIAKSHEHPAHRAGLIRWLQAIDPDQLVTKSGTLVANGKFGSGILIN